MAIVEGWLPPSRAHYELILRLWRLSYPVIGSMQWVVSWYGMGKTSLPSAFNIPGRVAWMTMESPGFLTLLYILNTVPRQHGIVSLPWQNRLLGGLFVIHYLYRAILFPLLQPSMAPIHVLVWAMAFTFQVCNATCLGSWLAAYGPVTAEAWAQQSPMPQLLFGVAIFYAGLASNFFHDEILREIRRKVQQRQDGPKRPDSSKNGVATKRGERHYEIPEAGLFRYMLYPHYFCEWVEWTGFLMAAGWSCAPAQAFLANEIFSMLPRAVKGKEWYIDQFGKQKVGDRWAVLPWIW